MDNKILYYLDEIEQLKSGAFVPPVTCEIDPSNKCMLDCTFCMFSDTVGRELAQDLRWETYKSLIYELKDLGVKSVTFTGGGEPLMNLAYNDMAELAFQLGFEVGLVSNGVAFDKLYFVEKYKFIRVSLDASNAEEYENVKGKNFFNKVCRNVKRLKKDGAKVVGLSYVVTAKNKDGIERAKDIADDLDVDYIQFKPECTPKGFKQVRTKVNDSRYIVTKRYDAPNTEPCLFASFIGVVGADENVYYCCQHRGEDYYNLGTLRGCNFETLWKRRSTVTPKVSDCPQCRYMNYVKRYHEVVDEGTLFFQHRNFL